MRPFRIWSPCIPVSAALAVIMAISPTSLVAQDVAAEVVQPTEAVEVPAVPPAAEPAQVAEVAVDTTAAVPSQVAAVDSVAAAIDTSAAIPTATAAVDSAAVDSAAVVAPASVVTKPKRYSDRANAFTLAGAASVAALVIGLTW